MVTFFHIFKMIIVTFVLRKLPSTQVHTHNINGCRNRENCTNNPNLVINKFPSTLKLRMGDINVGGLFEVYKPSTSSNDLCSNELDEYLILKAYAMIFAVDYYDKKFKELYNISLGYFILPTCSVSTIAQLQAINIREAMADKNMVAIIGPFSSLETMSLSPYLSYHKIPHISPTSNSYYFSERTMLFPYLFRLTTSQPEYLKALIALFLRFKWNTFAILYSDDPYYTYFVKRFRQQINRLKACIVIDMMIPYIIDSNYFQRSLVKEQFDKLLTRETPLVTIMLLNKQQNIEILSFIKEQKMYHKLIFIALNTWPDVSDLINAGLKDVALYAIIIDEFSDDISHFRSWMEYLSNDNSIWYRKWKSANSKEINSLKDKFILNGRNVNGNDSHNFNADYDSRLSIIIDAVSVIAIALQEELKICSSIHSIASRVRCITKHNLFPYIKNISFIGRTGPIAFDKGQSMNNMLRLSNMIKIKSIPGYSDVTVGTYNILEEKLTLFRHLRWKDVTYHNVSNAPASYCSVPCGVREIKVPSDTLCCWTCIKCRTNQKVTQDPVKPCLDCPIGTEVNLINNECQPIPRVYVTSVRSFANFIYIINNIALWLMLGLSIYYVINYNTTIFKMEIRTLLHLIFIGIFMGIVAIFLTNSRPKIVTCAIGQFMFLLSFVLIYATSLAKIIITANKLKLFGRNLRMVNMEHRVIYIVIAACLFQILINVALILYENGAPVEILNQNGTHAFIETYCPVYPHSIYLRALVMGYHYFLIIVSFLYNLKLEDLPPNFKEATLLRKNLYTIIAFYIIGLLIYTFSISFVALLLYQMFYLVIIYCVIICNTLYKLKAKRALRASPAPVD